VRDATSWSTSSSFRRSTWPPCPGLWPPPLIDAASERASDSSSRLPSSTGINRSSRNWSTSDACEGTRTRRTCDAAQNFNQKKYEKRNFSFERTEGRGLTGVRERRRLDAVLGLVVIATRVAAGGSLGGVLRLDEPTAQFGHNFERTFQSMEKRVQSVLLYTWMDEAMRDALPA
jgi:hypothetical protein